MNPAMIELGWKPFFEQQLEPDDEGLVQARIISHFGSQVVVLTSDGERQLPSQLFERCGAIGVGDWALLEPDTFRAVRRLQRNTLISRRAAGEVSKQQIIAANIDTLIVVSSCNQEFNLSRIERYLAIAIEAGATPVVVLTKVDLCDDPASFRRQAEKLHSGLLVETMDGRDETQIDVLEYWCRTGQTVALVGSSGVGKSTLANSLGARNIKTASIREDDDKGRHTTTTRMMHRVRFGGWLIDNPGMRELQLLSCEQGVEDLFQDVVNLARECRFNDCRHEGDDGCALQAAVESGQLEQRRLVSFLKLRAEQERNSESLAQRRDKDRRLGKFYKTVQSHNRKIRRDH